MSARFVLLAPAACLVVAGIAHAAPSTEVTDYYCDQCKSYVVSFKQGFPEFADRIQKFCNYIWNTDDRNTCLKTWKEVEGASEKADPEKVCTKFGFCGQQPNTYVKLISALYQ